MKGRDRKVIVIEKTRDYGTWPLLVSFAQRHLEKAMPPGEQAGTDGTRFQVPVDLLRIYGIKEELIDEIAEIALVYKAPGQGEVKPGGKADVIY